MVSLESSQYRQADEEDCQEDLFWREYLREVPEPIQLPFVSPRPAENSLRKERCSFLLSQEQCSDIEVLCTKRCITPSVFFLSVYFILLWKYSNQKTIIVGTRCNNNIETDLTDAVGSSSDPIPIRGDINDLLTAEQLFDVVASSLSLGMEHLQTWLDGTKVTGVCQNKKHIYPLFQVSYTYQKTHKNDVSAFGDQFLSEKDQSEYFISLYLNEGSGFSGVFEYVSDAFPLELGVRNIEKHFLAVLKWVLDNRQISLKNLSCLSKEDVLFIQSTNEKTNDQYLERTFPDLFRKTVTKNCNKVAAKYNGQCLTYEELDRASDTLAGYLLASGATSGSSVGVYVDRSLETLISFLAVLKSGAVYVPLDPNFPLDRIRYVVKNSDMEYLIVDEANENGELLKNYDLQLVSLKKLNYLREVASVALELPDVSPGQIAYMIYTSGSTGLPKGVPVTHKALANLLLSFAEQPGLLSGDILAAFSTTSFDMSVIDLLLPLIVGASLVIGDSETANDGQRLSRFLEQENITFMQATPVTWTILFITGWNGKRDLRMVSAGEELSKQLAVKLLGAGCEVWNGYGPTECTVYSTFYQVTDAKTDPLIGKPIVNTDLYILDENNVILPPGFIGELAIGGVCLSPGYHQNESLTKDAFVKISVPGKDTGERVYKTGDLAQLTGTGDYRCLGRKDSQVKIRGFRIELGEIEHILSSYPQVTDCCCIVSEFSSGVKKIVSYYTSDSPLNPSDLHTYLQAKLPSYMIPSFFVFMEEFPRTPSQKIDRKAFPLPDKPVSGVKNITKSTSEEDGKSVLTNTVKEAWVDALGVQEIQPVDDFFELGGHSLLVALVVTQLSEQIEKNIPMSLLYETSSLGSFTEALEKLVIEEKPSSVKNSFVQEVRKKWPLSPQQNRLWFFHEFSEDDPAYNLSLTLIVTGEIDMVLLEKAVQHVVESQEVFNTGIRYEMGKAIAFLRIDKPGISLRTLAGNASQQQIAFQAELKKENAKSFDFTEQTSKAVLYTFNDQKVAVVLFVPHILIDGVSFDIFHKQLDSAYHALLLGVQLSDEDTVEYQYSDYVDWLQRNPQQDKPQVISFWKNYLQGIPEQIQLPLTTPRPIELSSRGDAVFFAFSEELSCKVSEVCKELGVTPFIFLLSNFFLLLWKYSGQKSILVGAPYANRDRNELKNIIGFFVDMIPVRGDIDENLTVNQWFATIKNSFIQGLDNFQIGLDKIVEAAGTKRQRNAHPLFQVSFAYLSYLENTSCHSDFSMRQVFVNRGLSEYDISLFMWEENGFSGAFEYATDLFSPELMRGVRKHFQLIMEWVLENRNSCLKELSIFNRQDEHLTLALNNTVREEYLCRTFLDLYQESLLKHSTKISVQFNDRQLSYRELDLASDILASHLLAAGVKRGNFVGVYTDRGLNTLISLLAVFKSGAAYIPLDPGFPLDRLRYITENSGMEYIIVDAANEDAELLSIPALKVILVDQAKCWNEAGRNSLAFITTSPDQLAYMIYTSGSTGLPKGVPISHESLANFLLSVSENPGIHSNDIVAALTTTSFDISLLELLLPLATGASLVIADAEIAKNGRLLSHFLKQENITYMQATPVTWDILFISGWSGKADMKIVTGGEALSKQLAAKMLDTGSEVWNMYGPTECTIWSSCCRIVASADEPSIGKPIANTTYYILDENSHVLPQGLIGELAIGGVSLSPGYHFREELTEKFFVDIPTPGEKTGERLYKTGDLAKLTDTGAYQCFGRKDGQIKVRGYRIELGEIEHNLQAHSDIVDCCCIVHAYSEIDKRIIAYYKSKTPVDSAKLGSYLQLKLPSYMIPGFFVYMEEFPKTPNQKIDRKALPLPDNKDLISDNKEIIEPTNALESEMLQIWRAILHNENIGVMDNFFDSGGNSLLAMVLIQRLNDEMTAHWKLRTLFEYPTVRSLSSIEQKNEYAKLPLLFPVQKKGEKRPLFLIAGVYGDLYRGKDGEKEYERSFLRYFSNILKILGTDRPIYGLRARGMFEGESLHSNIGEMADEYIEKIKTISPIGPYLIGGECLGGLVAYEVVQRLKDEGEDIQLLVLMDTYKISFKTECEFIIRSYKKKFERWWSEKNNSEGGNSNRYARKLIRYRPKNYEGQTLLLINEDWNARDPRLNWNRKILPNLSVEIVKGNHITRLQEHGELCGEILSRYLNHLQ